MARQVFAVHRLGFPGETNTCEERILPSALSLVNFLEVSAEKVFEDVHTSLRCISYDTEIDLYGYPTGPTGLKVGIGLSVSSECKFERSP